MFAAILIMILPVVLYLLAVRLADRYEKELVPFLALAVIAGALVAPRLVSLVERVLGVPNSIFPNRAGLQCGRLGHVPQGGNV